MFNGELIKHLRRLRNVSQEELAERLEVTRGTVSNWEIGRRTPDFLMLVKICDIFNVSLDLFVLHNPAQTAREVCAQVDAFLADKEIKQAEKEKLCASLCTLFAEYGIKK